MDERAPFLLFNTEAELPGDAALGQPLEAKSIEPDAYHGQHSGGGASESYAHRAVEPVPLRQHPWTELEKYVGLIVPETFNAPPPAPQADPASDFRPRHPSLTEHKSSKVVKSKGVHALVSGNSEWFLHAFPCERLHALDPHDERARHLCHGPAAWASAAGLAGTVLRIGPDRVLTSYHLWKKLSSLATGDKPEQPSLPRVANGRVFVVFDHLDPVLDPIDGQPTDSPSAVPYAGWGRPVRQVHEVVGEIDAGNADGHDPHVGRGEGLENDWVVLGIKNPGPGCTQVCEPCEKARAECERCEEECRKCEENYLRCERAWGECKKACEECKKLCQDAQTEEDIAARDEWTKACDACKAEWKACRQRFEECKQECKKCKEACKILAEACEKCKEECEECKQAEALRDPLMHPNGWTPSRIPFIVPNRDWIHGHPHDRLKMLSLVGHPLGVAKRVDRDGQVVAYGNHLFQHDLDSFSGDSGAPIFREAQTDDGLAWWFVGMNLGGLDLEQRDGYLVPAPRFDTTNALTRRDNVALDVRAFGRAFIMHEIVTITITVDAPNTNDGLKFSDGKQTNRGASAQPLKYADDRTGFRLQVELKLDEKLEHAKITSIVVVDDEGFALDNPTYVAADGRIPEDLRHVWQWPHAHRRLHDSPTVRKYTLTVTIEDEKPPGTLRTTTGFFHLELHLRH